uniref:Uncharacterized protein n=1 Tax=Anguilla anguilla TaxID=7936 RepID=A0A0E9PZB1_ANGAN
MQGPEKLPSTRFRGCSPTRLVSPSSQLTDV